MKKTIPYAILFIILGHNAAIAQSQSVTEHIKDAIDNCVNGSTAVELRKLVRTWGMTPDYAPLLSSQEAIACYKAFIGKDVVFLNGNYVAADSIGRETDIQRQRRLEQEAAARERLNEARKAANTKTVNGKVYNACVELAKQDHITAYTNQLCVNSFKANGDPS